MKTLIFITGIIGASLMACSDNIRATDVPSVVLNTFKTQFPTAAKVEWEKAEALYEAEFQLENTAHAVRLTADGRMAMQKKEIDASHLPITIQSLLKKNFGNYLAEDIEQVETNGLSYYQIELEKNGKPDEKLVLSSDGTENTSLPFWD
ncbi:PepSY-like domain-containing protein [Paradesertivirga mongoliensis]|uniref:PepSY-like domain-containing protein n=1 Tax=Paradesertivirga mongoliensis TaxID=2100740 RepID=A0ABW4ZSD4_9SPHI|nr:PepSY-like domain-containing protein [Pedobacter mongoliensis]